MAEGTNREGEDQKAFFFLFHSFLLFFSFRRLFLTAVEGAKFVPRRLPGGRRLLVVVVGFVVEDIVVGVFSVDDFGVFHPFLDPFGLSKSERLLERPHSGSGDG